MVIGRMELKKDTISKPSIAITGFPKAGKSALLAAIQHTDVAEAFDFTELPGVFMLGRNTPVEEQAYDYLLGRPSSLGMGPPFGIVSVVDASELSRQLYLAFQLIDLRLPFVLYLTGVEEAAGKGITVDKNKLAELIGVKVLSAEQDAGAIITVLRDWRDSDVEKVVRKPTHWRPSMALADAYQHLDTEWIHKHLHLYTGARLVEGLRLITVPRAIEDYEAHPAYKSLLRNLDQARKILEDRREKWTMAEVIQRNKWITQTLQAAVSSTVANNDVPDDQSWWRSLFGKK